MFPNEDQKEKGLANLPAVSFVGSLTFQIHVYKMTDCPNNVMSWKVGPGMRTQAQKGSISVPSAWLALSFPGSAAQQRGIAQ